MNQKGFTLIELVVVIVILGILAVTAAPKFLRMQNDARISVLKGLEGALRSTNDMIYSKASMKGIENTAYGTPDVDPAVLLINGRDVYLNFGYITPTIHSIKTTMDINSNEWNIKSIGGIHGVILTPVNGSGGTASSYDEIVKSQCYLEYKFVRKDPIYELNITKC